LAIVAAGYTYRSDFNFAGQMTDSFDPLGQKIHYTLNSRGWITQITDPRGKNWTTGYDAAGNLTSKVHNTTTETWTYTYNGDNLLVKAKHKATSTGSIDLRIEFKYDVFGNRIQKSVDNDGDGPLAAVITKFAYENGNAWADLDAAGSLTTRRLYGFGLDTLLARIITASGGGNPSDEQWYLLDKLGSVRDLVNSAGAVIDHLAYDPFGKITTETNPSNGDRYKFTARERETEWGAIYYRERFQLDGRWMSVDPIGFKAGDPNLYRYVFNSPNNFIDPTGLQVPEDIVELMGSAMPGPGGAGHPTPEMIAAMRAHGEQNPSQNRQPDFLDDATNWFGGWFNGFALDLPGTLECHDPNCNAFRNGREWGRAHLYYLGFAVLVRFLAGGDHEPPQRLEWPPPNAIQPPIFPQQFGPPIIPN